MGSTGTPASILGTVSGPYNYDPGSVLTYSVAGSSRTLALPSNSHAELRSKSMPTYSDPPVGAVCAIRNALGQAWELAAAAWGSGAAAATALNAAALGATVIWDADTHQLVFRSSAPADAPALALLGDTLPRAAFAGWLMATGAARAARGAPVPTDDVLTALAADSRLKATVERTVIASFTGRRSAVSGQTAMLLHSVASGTELETDGTTLVRAPVDLEALGVVPGMLLCVAGYHHILAVAGGELILEAPLLLGSPLPYVIGPDYTSLEPGARVYLSGGADSGTYRVVQGGYAQLELDRPLSSTADVPVSLASERLRLTLRDASAPFTLAIEASPGATALGLAPQTALPGLASFDTGTELGLRGVAPGDRLVLEHGAGLPTTHVVTAVEGTLARFTPAQPREVGPLRYAIRDALVQDYLLFRNRLLVVQTGPAFDNSTELDQAVARLSRGARFSGALVTTLVGYVTALGALTAACDSYVVPRDSTVEQALRLMVEHGFDRAADLFVGLHLTEFFALEADGVSYRTQAYRAAAEVAQLVVPVSKDARDPTTLWRSVAIQPANDGRG
jgi:CBS domain-containing protein